MDANSLLLGSGGLLEDVLLESLFDPILSLGEVGTVLSGETVLKKTK